MYACSTMSKVPSTTFETRRLSKQRGRDKLLAQSAISLTVSVGARYHEVSSAQLRGDDSPEVAKDSVVHVDRDRHHFGERVSVSCGQSVVVRL